MRGIELVVLLLAVCGALRMLAIRINIPYPVLFVLGGLALAVIPGIPRPSVDPDTIFLVFVPPLLYWAALNTSLRDFKQEFWPIARYGTLVVLMTMAAVAVVTHLIAPEIGWSAGFLLGAIVSPPDPIAATAVLRPLGAPRRLVTILEGEGLVNDATALVAYRFAVAAVVTGTFSLGAASVRLLITGAGGVAIGLATGWLIARVRKRLGTFPIVENTLSLLTPFIAYIPADALGLSGVLAVVTIGLYLGRKGSRILSSATRVQAEGMWTVVAFLLESLIFILIGLDLPFLHDAVGKYSLRFLLALAAATALACVVVRILYSVVAVLILRAVRRARGKPSAPAWNEASFIAWTGMRGGDSLVIALALPKATQAGAAFPGRDLIIFTTFSVILVTLVVQGFTVVPLLKWLDLHDDGEADAEEARARLDAAKAGMARLDALSKNAKAPRETVDLMRRHYEKRIRRWSARDGGGDGDGATESEAERMRALKAALIDTERETVIKLRDDGTIGDDVLRRVQRDLDLEQMLIDAGDADAPESPYEPEPDAV